MSNLQELKAIHKTALITEMIEKTRACTFVWNQLSPGNYKSTAAPYEFYLSKVTGSGSYILDVLKHGQRYRSYNSTVNIEVAELFALVDGLTATLDQFMKTRKVGNFLSQIRGCAPITHNIVMNGGIFGNGDVTDSHLRPVSFLLLPQTLTFGPTSFPWTGGVTDISDVPNAASHDGDTSYIRQQVSGALPTQWGYAICNFNVSSLAGLSGPLTFVSRAAHRREVESGVTIFLDTLVNSTVVHTTSTLSDTSYNLLFTPQTLIPGITNITTLQVRVSMFTNSGNPNPRALRISAVDIEVFGFNSL